VIVVVVAMMAMMAMMMVGNPRRSLLEREAGVTSRMKGTIAIVEGGKIAREAVAITILQTMVIPAMMTDDVDVVVIVVVVTPRNQNAVVRILPRTMMVPGMATTIARGSANAKQHDGAIATRTTGTAIAAAEAGATTAENDITTGGGDVGVEAAVENDVRGAGRIRPVAGETIDVATVERRRRIDVRIGLIGHRNPLNGSSSSIICNGSFPTFEYVSSRKRYRNTTFKRVSFRMSYNRTNHPPPAAAAVPRRYCSWTTDG